MGKREIEFEVSQRPDKKWASIKNRDGLIECVEELIKCLDDGLRSGIGAGERHRGSTLSAANRSWRRRAYGPRYLRTVSALLFRAFANGGLLSKYNSWRKSCEE